MKLDLEKQNTTCPRRCSDVLAVGCRVCDVNMNQWRPLLVVLMLAKLRLIYPPLRDYRVQICHPCGFGVSAPLDKHGGKTFQ